MYLYEDVLKTLKEDHPILAQSKKYNGKWSYDYGVILNAVKEIYLNSNDESLFEYIQVNMDYFIQEDGTIKNYRQEEYNLDHLNNGKLLFLLYEKTGLERYKNALDTLFNQIQNMPRTSQGGFWHKKIYPYQMWLDGLYMSAPFYAEYLIRFENGSGLDDVIKQFELCYQHTLDSQTGLLYHAWDEKKEQFWADPETGCSPNFWGRSMGWYVMALVNVIELLEEENPKREVLVEQLKSLLHALKNVSDPVTKLWYQVLDKGHERGNYLEASATSMILYAIAKSYELDFSASYTYEEIQELFTLFKEEFVFYTQDKKVNLIRNCEVAGLGGDDNRDGSFVYYISEPIITNDFKGYGAFLAASHTIEHLNK
ncbi:glycoside hydrolase family 88/105 protein [Fundicoccus sp. Sow4_H7]|uniref:glycoside hydrolase family 88/105 protein n=1 Tax=Fundicoccus sp. Sow4_H7 TaxID=3438784 RepID=UPI003F900D9D